MNTTQILLIGYLAAQFVICYVVTRKINSEEDFLLAGRTCGTGLITLSLFATWFGAETCIGSSAEVFSFGLSGSRADPLGYCLCLVMSGLLIAPKIWNKNYTTLADVYATRFGPKTERFAVLILSLSSLIWAAAQLRAFGQVISSTTDLPVDLTLFLSFIFVVGYVMYGGLLGDIITDSVQAVVIFVGLGTLVYFIFKEHPDLISYIVNQPAERLTLIKPNESWLQRIDRWAIPILGSLVAQEIVSRLLAARNVKIATRSSYYAAMIYIFVGLIPVLIGLVGPQIVNFELKDKEHFLVAVAEHYLPIMFMPIFAGALISALLATIDSILIAVSGLFAHNVIVPRLKIKDEKTKVLTVRLCVVGSAGIAYFLAYNSDSIYSLLEMASSFGTSGILVITLAGLWLNKSSDNVALTTLFIGLIVNPFYDYVLKLDSPFVFSIFTCGIIYFTLPYIFKFIKVENDKMHLAESSEFKESI